MYTPIIASIRPPIIGSGMMLNMAPTFPNIPVNTTRQAPIWTIRLEPIWKNQEACVVRMRRVGHERRTCEYRQSKRTRKQKKETKTPRKTKA